MEKITLLDNITCETKLADLIIDCPELLFVVNVFGIKMGFGERSIKEICLQYKIVPSDFVLFLKFTILGKDSNLVKLAKVDPRVLLNYIKVSHKYFIDYRFPDLRDRLTNALALNESKKSILDFFNEYEKEVKKHMKLEDEVFFPYIESLLNNKVDNSFSASKFKSNHDDIQDKLEDLFNLLVKYISTKIDNFLLSDILILLERTNRELSLHEIMENKVLIPIIKKIEIIKNIDSAAKDEESEELSKREIEIIQGIASGLSNKEIAGKLFISVHTVNTHRRNICNKLSIHSAAGLTVYAILNKLIDIDNLIV